MHEGQRVVQEQSAILRYHAVHDDDANHGVQIQRIIHEEKEKQRTDQPKRQRKHTDEGRLHRLIKHRKDHIHQDHAHEERGQKLHEAFRHAVCLPRETEAHRPRQPRLIQVLREAINDRGQRLAAGISTNDDGAHLIGAIDGDGPGFIFNFCHIRESHHARLALDGNRREVRPLVRLATGKIHIDIRIIAIIQRVIGQHPRPGTA